MEVTLNFNYRKYRWGVKIPAVYKISFDTKMFYIGSSCHIKSRVYDWVRGLSKMKDIICGKNVTDAIKAASSATIDLIEICDRNNVRDREEFYLKKHEKDEGFINATIFVSKSVSKFDLNGNFITKYKSISEAAKCNNTKVGKIQRVVSGERKSFHKFRYESENYPQYAGHNFIYGGKHKRVNKIDSLGNVVATFKNKAVAARDVNSHPRSIARVIEGTNKTCKGFSYKFA